MSQSAYPIDRVLTAIAVGYKNTRYIADDIAPRIMVGSPRFSWLRYDDQKFFTLPETLVGRRSTPNEVNLDAFEETGQVQDHGLDGGVPNVDVDAAKTFTTEDGAQIYDPIANETEFLTYLVASRREKRVADLVTNPSNYDPALQQVLTGADKFSNPNSDVIGIINDSMDRALMPLNIGVIGRPLWTKLKSHRQIVEAVRGTGAKEGNVSRQSFADMFELDDILIGEQRYNLSVPGQAPQIVRGWGDSMALLHRSDVPQAIGSSSFISTFQWGGRIAMQWDEKKMGARGGIGIRVAESLTEIIVAKQSGYLIREAL